MTGSPPAAPRRVTVTGLAQQRAWRARELPPVEQVTPGVWSVPVTIPDSPLRYTLAYLLLADSGAVVVDPGWETDTGWADLRRGLQSAGLTPDQVTGIVVTHVHLDHHGLSGRLREESGAWIAMHTEEVQNLPVRIGEAVGGADGARDWLVRSGVPGDVVAELSADYSLADALLHMALPDRLLTDGEHVDLPGRRIRVVWTPGHTPGHVCLYDADYDLLLTGDHLLPRISPNIGLAPGTPGSPLSSYLESLQTMHGYAGAEALPAHEYRFRGIADRADALVQHHDARTRELLDVVAAAGQPTIWEVTTQLTWSRSWDQITGFMRRAALAETAAHIEYLERSGQLITRAGAAQEPYRVLVAPGARPRAGRTV
jgi:glyoxylase-like metal-dependent hydrolase (beta-lactamase superfamily II)